MKELLKAFVKLKYKVEVLTEQNTDEVFDLCKENKEYYSFLRQKPTKKGVKTIFTDLPPHSSIEKKHVLGFYDKEKLIAVLDLVEGYPYDGAVFIGLFILDVSVQGKGIGGQIINQLLICLRKKFDSCHLGVIKDNDKALLFWQKHGFFLTGEKYIHPKFIVVMMCKEL